MTEADPLTLAFLEYAPEAAARVMQELPTGDVAGFLDTVPARLAAPAVNALTGWHAARCLEQIAPERAALILRQLSFNDVTSVVRLMRADSFASICEELPGSYARRLRGALHYPAHQVGAWIDPAVPVLACSDTVDRALLVLRSGEPASHVFLQADDDATFAGGVRVCDVLRADPSARLDQLPVERFEPISNRASLATVNFDERWDESLFLPVVGRRGTVLGGLSRQALRRGLQQHQARAGAPERTIPQQMASALLIASAGLLDLLTRSEPAAPNPRKGPMHTHTTGPGPRSLP